MTPLPNSSPEPAPPTDLVTLADRINAEHMACEGAFRSAVAHAIEAGRLLIEARAGVGHGGWLAWVRDRCRFSERTARGYMQLARHVEGLDESKRQRVAELPLRDALALLARPRPQSTCSRGEPPAGPSASGGDEEDWMTTVATSPSPFSDLLSEHGLAGSSGRMSPVPLRSTEDGRLEPSSGGWQNAGTWGPTGSWTFTVSELPNDAVASSLWDILDPPGSPGTPALLPGWRCRRMLDRLAKYGKKIPPELEAILRARIAADPTPPPPGAPPVRPLVEDHRQDLDRGAEVEHDPQLDLPFGIDS